MRTLALFLIGLVFGGGIGFTTAAGMGVTFDGHDHSNPAHHGAGRDHAMAHDTPLLVGGANVPQLRVSFKRDPVSGFNLHLNTKNFAFSPEQAGLDHVQGQGHAHLYVNGVKVQRVYSNWVHIDGLPKGTSTIEVTLNSNDHRPLMLGESLIKFVGKLEVE